MRFRFHPEALAEFEAAADFYQAGQPGLETRFAATIRRAIEQICATPERWRLFDGEVRRYLVNVFPFAVLYSIEKDSILLIAVMHCSRKPGYWRRRIL